jgi:hypothetical protein
MRRQKLSLVMGTTFLLLVAAGERTNRLPECARAQSFATQEELTSWWASPVEPDMLETEGSLKDPESVRVRVDFNGALRTLSGYEAIAFLLGRNYVEYVTVSGRLRLRTTPKYEAWKKSKPASPKKKPVPPAGTGSSQITMQLNPDVISQRLANFRKRGEDESFQTSAVVLTLSPDPGQPDQGRAELSPSQLEHIQRWTMANGDWFETKNVMQIQPGRFSDLFPNQGGRASGGMQVTVYKRNKSDQTWKLFTGNPNATWNGIRVWNTSEWRLRLAGEEVNEWVGR